MQDELGFPDKLDPNKCRVAELKLLNDILCRHVVPDRNGCAEHNFWCLEWESDLCQGVLRARCYPFNMPNRHLHIMNIKVGYMLYKQRIHFGYPIHPPEQRSGYYAGSRIWRFLVRDLLVGVWWRSFCVAIDTLVDLINWLGNPQVFFRNHLLHAYP